jgi:hypothetical protein
MRWIAETTCDKNCVMIIKAGIVSKVVIVLLIYDTNVSHKSKITHGY